MASESGGESAGCFVVLYYGALKVVPFGLRFALPLFEGLPSVKRRSSTSFGQFYPSLIQPFAGCRASVDGG